MLYAYTIGGEGRRGGILVTFSLQLVGGLRHSGSAGAGRKAQINRARRDMLVLRWQHHGVPPYRVVCCVLLLLLCERRGGRDRASILTLTLSLTLLRQLAAATVVIVPPAWASCCCHLPLHSAHSILTRCHHSNCSFLHPLLRPAQPCKAL